MKTETLHPVYRNQTGTITLHAIEPGELTEGQAVKAAAFAATHYFTTGDMRSFPKYQHADMTAAGWVYTQIGHTTYASATWGAKKNPTP